MKKAIAEAETNKTAPEVPKVAESDVPALENLKLEVSELEKQEAEFRKKEEELKKKEKLTPWNIDTICHEGKSKTIINKPKPKEELTEEEKLDRQQNFVKRYKEEIKKFGMMRKYDTSMDYLLEHPHLVCEETANYLVLWCIDLQLEEKELMNQVAHQTIVMQFMLELAKQLDTDPKNCIRAFFSRIKVGEKQYMDAFNDELDAFKDRVKKRAQARIEEAMREHEEEERQKRLGPGGLDPVEVFESLPDKLKECFEKKDIELLQKVILELPKEEAEFYMKRCVDSGLWVPNANEGSEKLGVQESGEQVDEDKEETYDEPGEK
ncbi:hypothetical protein ACJMK2_027555 [Sinanodonta woodiana]